MLIRRLTGERVATQILKPAPKLPWAVVGALAGAILVGAAGHARAVEQPATAAGQGGVGGSGGAGRALEATVSLDFPGGTVEQFVLGLRSATAAPVNVVYGGGAERVRLPAMQIKNVDVEIALRAVQYQAKSAALQVARIMPEPQPGFPQNFPAGGAPVFAINRADRAGRSGDEGSRIISLNEITRAQWASGGGEGKAGPISPKTVLTAIETATSVADEEPAELKFHQESGLLFVTGSVRQCKLAEEVVMNLQRDVDREVKRYRSAGGGKAISEIFSLAHASPADFMDAVRMVTSNDPSQPARALVVPGEKGNTAIVTAPEDVMMTVRALTRVVDRPVVESPELVKLKLQLEDALRRLSDSNLQRREGDAELQKVLQDARAQSLEAEKLRGRLQVAEKEASDFRTRAKDLEIHLTQAMDSIAALERQQESLKKMIQPK